MPSRAGRAGWIAGFALVGASGCEPMTCWTDWEFAYELTTEVVPDVGDVRGAVEIDGAVLVVGTGGIIARRGVDGVWSSSGSVTDFDLHAVDHADGVTLAVGSGGVVLRSEDGGLAWTTIDTGLVVAWTDVDLDGAHAWLVGEGATLRSEDSGQTWTEVAMPDGDPGAVLRGVALHDGQAWAVGPGARMFVSDVDGSAWAPYMGRGVWEISGDLWDIGVAGLEPERHLYAVGDDTVLVWLAEEWSTINTCATHDCDYTGYTDGPPPGEYRRVGGNYLVGLDGLIVVVSHPAEVEDEGDPVVRIAPVASSGPDLWASAADLVFGDAATMRSVTVTRVYDDEPTCQAADHYSL